MSEFRSKIVLTLEALFLALPVTFLAAVAVVGALAFLGKPHPEPYEIAQLSNYLLPIPSLMAGWFLIYRFLSQGSVGLRSAGNLSWTLIAFGTIVATAALLTRATFDIHGFENSPTSLGWFLVYFRELAFGLPALIPSLHLAAERAFRTSSNQRLERA